MSDELPSAQRHKLGWLIGVAAAFTIFAVIAAYSKRMTNDTPGYEDQRAEERYATLAKIQDAENKLIEPAELGADGKPDGKVTAEWVDQAKGTVRIPIEQAMAKEIDTLKAMAPASGAEIPGSKPAAPAAAPAASTNAAPAAVTAPASTNATTAPKPPEKAKK